MEPEKTIRPPEEQKKAKAPAYKAPWWRLKEPEDSEDSEPSTPREAQPRPAGGWAHIVTPSIATELKEMEGQRPSGLPSPVTQQPTAKETLLRLMRKHCNGNLAVAWRRFFDKDHLTFQDFCGVLSTLGFHQDALALWHTLDPKGTHRLELEMFDPKGARLIAD